MNTKQQTKLIQVINGASKILLTLVFIALFTLIIKNA
jgi:hypothetical protein